MKFTWLDTEIKNAVKYFWQSRNGGEGVLAGKTLDQFREIIMRVVKESGLPDAKFYTGKQDAQLPGYFRPHKAWDVVILNNNKLVAAIELKSQVGSIGNNFNNRSEEVLGSSYDLRTAVEEQAFGDDANIFLGYLILVEQSNDSMKNPKIEMKHFPVMEGFLKDERERGNLYKRQTDGTYPTTKGISYLERYDIMCKRLMIKNLYRATALLAVSNTDLESGNYSNISPETSIITFMAKLSSHCEVVSTINSQRK